MHVLIVAYHYPPSTAVGAIRPSRMAGLLRERGHCVTIVSAGVGSADQPAISEGIHVAHPLPGPRDLYLRLKRWLHRRRSPSRSAATPRGSSALTSSRTSLLRRAVLALMWLPDDAQGFILPAARHARRIHRNNPVDVVITTAPPFSVHLAGILIRRWLGAAWIADFRDPWTANSWKQADIRTRTTDRLEQWLEGAVLRRADLVVSASEGIARSLASSRAQHSRSSAQLIVLNGIEAASGRSSVAARRQFRIAYLGTFYLGRDPRAFLDALANVVRRHRFGADDLRVDLIGNCQTFNGDSVPRMVSELQLDQVVLFRSRVPRDEALEIAAAADLLLLLAQEQPDQVPQKLYEYLATRNPILAIADTDGETARMLNRVGGHYLPAADDRAAIENAIEAALSRPRGEPVGDPAVLEEWATTNQFARFLEAVEALCSRDPVP